MSNQRIEVGPGLDGLAFRVVGEASVRQAATLRNAAQAAFLQGVRNLQVDLSECTAIDSTFWGCLLKLYKENGGGFVLASPSATVMTSLRASGFEQVFPIHNDPIDADWKPLELPGWDEADLGAVVLTSHETLSAIDERNRRIYEPVVEQLRREMKRD